MKVLLLLNFFILFRTFLCDDKGGRTFSKDSEKCGGTFSGFQYPILSPNYPDNYPMNQNCVYTLKGSQSANCDQEFHLQFLDFQLEASKGCGKDYVKVGSSSIYCGNSIGIRKFKGQDKSLKVVFHSDANTTARGFRILVTTLPCADSELDPKENVSMSGLKIDTLEETSTRTKENIKMSYPIIRPEVKFDSEDEGRGDQPPSQIYNGESSPKNPSENLELPEFQQHDFNDENCGHSHSMNDDGIGSITSYLYLPPSPITRPLKVSGTKTSSPSPGVNISREAIPNGVVIRYFDDEELQVTESPTDFIVPSHQIPPPFIIQDLQKTIKTFQPLKPQSSSQFYNPTNRWITYGVPNPGYPANPSIPDNNNNFDPFANGNNDNDNNNNNNPRVNYNPGAPACGGDNNNPNYYPVNNNNNNNGNWNPNFNPVDDPYHPNTNFGNGNGYGDAGNNYDTSTGMNDNSNPNSNYYPNNEYYNPVDTTYYDTGLTECCGTTYSSSSFLLTNPGFPSLIYSSSNYQCQYTIQRSSSNICRLQMYLKFFNFGSDDQFCAYGYLEIDGNRICGCKTGANVTSSFDNIATKTITVKYLGYPKIKFNGFVIEVTQVPCSTGYLRFRNELQRRNPILIRSYQRNYKRSTGEENPVKNEERESTSRAKRDLGYSHYRHGANFAALTTSQNLFLNSCRIFKFLNWVKAVKQVYLKSAQCSSTVSGNRLSSSISVIPIFPDTASSALINLPSSSNCETVNVAEGTISSPYYPNSYSNNLNQCYRFYKAPGYCQLELAILDFDLENSTLCRKDYVSFSGQKRRYCGTSLIGSRTIFDMTRSTFADLYFVTDSSGSGRGFRIGFTQISC